MFLKLCALVEMLHDKHEKYPPEYLNQSTGSKHKPQQCCTCSMDRQRVKWCCKIQNNMQIRNTKLGCCLLLLRLLLHFLHSKLFSHGLFCCCLLFLSSLIILQPDQLVCGAPLDNMSENTKMQEYGVGTRFYVRPLDSICKNWDVTHLALLVFTLLHKTTARKLENCHGVTRPILTVKAAFIIIAIRHNPLAFLENSLVPSANVLKAQSMVSFQFLISQKPSDPKSMLRMTPGNTQKPTYRAFVVSKCVAS